jgi:coproporphyrinogen III oxidase
MMSIDKKPELFSADATAFSQLVEHHQDAICTALEKADGSAVFSSDAWQRKEGGGGVTRIITNGKVLEKGGVNRSDVWGELPAFMRSEHHTNTPRFFATGLSIVMHPSHPLVPIIHMNIRYFETEDGKYWFGGGIDLTPSYIDLEQARYFHSSVKAVCNKYHPKFYEDFCKQAASYFYIPHRKETRGIGGIFFDHLMEENSGLSKESLRAFCSDLAALFPVVYTRLIEENKNKPWGEREKNWQLLRRGRYAEFNLVYDRGTRFGLETDGRTESILMSLPPVAHWEYMHEPEVHSEEARTLELLRNHPVWI